MGAVRALPLPRRRAIRKPRRCHVCGDPYNRCHSFHTWPTQNPGKRLGWQDYDLKVCMRCGPEAAIRHALITASARFRRTANE